MAKIEKTASSKGRTDVKASTLKNIHGAIKRANAAPIQTRAATTLAEPEPEILSAVEVALRNAERATDSVWHAGQRLEIKLEPVMFSASKGTAGCTDFPEHDVALVNRLETITSRLNAFEEFISNVDQRVAL